MSEHTAMLAEIRDLYAKLARVEAALLEGGQTPDIRVRNAIRVLTDPVYLNPKNEISDRWYPR